MTERSSSIRCSVLFFFFTFIALFGFQNPLHAQQPTGPRIWLGESQPVALGQNGAFAPAGASLLAGAAPSPVALASADLDGDGVADQHATPAISS